VKFCLEAEEQQVAFPWQPLKSSSAKAEQVDSQ